MTLSYYNSRLFALLNDLKKARLDAFIQPVNDEYQGEYTPLCAQRLEWVSGFTGSAGTAVFLADKQEGKPALLFVDGRYTLQAASQVATEHYHILNSTDKPVMPWLAKHLPAGARIGYDAWLHTQAQVQGWRAIVAKAGLELVQVPNLIDEGWADRPAPPAEAVAAHPLEYAGEDVAEKCRKLTAVLADQQADAMVLALPDGINWLLNIRGADIEFNPLVLAFAIVDKSGGIHVITQSRSFDWAAHYPDIKFINYNAFIENPYVFLSGYARLMMDPQTVASWFFTKAEEAGCTLIPQKDPTLQLKAIKNDAEREGIRAAHRRDGVALSRFLLWLERESAQRAVSELEVVDKLEHIRMDCGGNMYRGQSFATIAGSGPNGAIVHYRATQESNRTLANGELFLLDSGGQYLDGTTDVTRTVAIGTPTDEMRDRFTRVLKGHIAIATALFPRGTTGSQLDALARQYLWDAACDYDHGTGHGVGAYLCVHEGPQRISKRGGDTPLEIGMVLSNEPGYYKTGEYGIRIENLVLVIEGPAGADGRQFLQFETLTLAPIDRKLIDYSMLTEKEVQWLDAYHERVSLNNEKS